MILTRIFKFHISPGLLAALVVVALATGCAHMPYKLGQDLEGKYTLRLRKGEAQFETGRPNKFLDGAGHYVFSLPSKLVLWNWQVENHRISDKTREHIRQYLHANGLRHVKVRFNQYAPGGEWGRLFRNKEVHGFWRYTLGVGSVLVYTIAPGRLFGGDHYNPYTNTISIYSNVPAIGIHEGGHAKDFARRSRAFKGWYALIRNLPLVSLYQEAIATGDAVGYYRTNDLVSDEKAGYKILYPAYGTYIANEVLTFAPGGRLIPQAVIAAAVIPAHIIGRIKAATVRKKPKPAK